MNDSESKPLSDVERIKSASQHLRGTLVESLADPLTGAIADDDTQLSKFHGIYQQDDRDIRQERRKQRLEPAFSFMIRARIPGGRMTPAQWLAFDAIGRRYGNDSVRVTTRQAVQFHGVIKRRLKTTMQAINTSLLDTLAACGDVNRNVMAPANPATSPAFAAVQAAAQSMSDHLCPRTNAYHEVWLDKEKLIDTADEVEPIYGKTYLPRKFKAAFVIPPDNDVDVYSQDLGFVAVVEAGQLVGFNVMVGGGMGMSHGEPETYPRLASTIGFCRPAAVNAVAAAVVTTQRDFGDRTNRKHARLKYTIDTHGLAWFRDEVNRRLDEPLEAAREVRFTHTGDRYGWQQASDGSWQHTFFVENGRVADSESQQLLSAMREIASLNAGAFILTPNQNVIVAGLNDAERREVAALIAKYNLSSDSVSALRAHSLACVGFPTCGLAMAESERYMPELVTKVDALLDKHGVADVPIVARMTGCPNGCARPYLAEIGLVGKAPGRYNLLLGASFNGDRLNRLYKENIDETEILATLDELFAGFASQRHAAESFGDFLHRSGRLTRSGTPTDFHSPQAVTR
ncbi:MAG: NADPH-dependent assimilatory sulfite reductase hemoprotein subunit [Pseudomonadota bacterium]